MARAAGAGVGDGDGGGTTRAPSAAVAPSAAANIQAGNTAGGQQLTPTPGTDAAGNASFAVNTGVAANPFLQGDLSQIKNQQAAVAGQHAAQATTPSQALTAQAAGPSALSVAQATTPSQALTAQSGPSNVNSQGFDAQAQALKSLQQQAQGGGPAAQAIQMQTQQATNQGINAQLAMAGSMRGGNAGEALRQASLGQAQVTGQAGAQAAQNTLASEQQGINNVGQVAGAMQGESLGQAQLGQQNNQFNAGATNQANSQTQALGQQTALANAASTNTAGLQTQALGTQTALANTAATNQANAQTQALGNQTANANAAQQNNFTLQQNAQIQSLMNSGMSLEQAQQQANISMAEYATGSAADQYAAGQGHAISQQNADTSSASAAIQGLGTVASIGSGVASTASDVRAKKNVSSADKDVTDFLKSLAAKTWDYKNPQKHGAGRHLGVMAQDLEKSKMGKGMVKTGPDGVKMVQYGSAKGMAAIVASLAHLAEKMDKLEHAKKGK